MLERSESLLDVSYETGLSGPGRLHDLFVTWEAVSPGEYKSRGESLEIDYGFHPSPFGECLLAVTPRGICGLEFILNGDRSAALGELKRRWPRAALHENAGRTQKQLAHLFAFYDGEIPQELGLHVWGTPFQLKVWEPCCTSPPARCSPMKTSPCRSACPRRRVAVGNAIGRNPVPVLIPCHRVIRRTGELGRLSLGRGSQESPGWAGNSPGASS